MPRYDTGLYQDTMGRLSDYVKQKLPPEVVEQITSEVDRNIFGGKVTLPKIARFGQSLIGRTPEEQIINFGTPTITGLKVGSFGAEFAPKDISNLFQRATKALEESGIPQLPKSPVRGNMAYGYSLDPDTTCPKQGCISSVIDKFKDFMKIPQEKPIGFGQYNVIRNTMKDAGIEVPCAQCYTQAHRIKGTTMATSMEGIGTYNDQIIKLKGASKPFKKMMEESGAMRWLSNTDAKPQHIPIFMEALYDASQRGLPIGAYTKQPWFAEAFGPSGANINISIAGKTDNFGNLIPDLENGIDWGTAFKIRSKYPNVSTTMVSLDPKATELALNNPNIDHIIPLKRSAYSGTEMQTIIEGAIPHAEHEPAIPALIKQSWDKNKVQEYLFKKGESIPYAQYLNHPNYMKLITEWGKFGDKNSIIPVIPKVNDKVIKEMATVQKMQEYGTSYAPPKNLMNRIISNLSNE